jgi:hypothetical protein
LKNVWLAENHCSVAKAAGHRSLAKVNWMFAFACAAYNLVRMRNLLPQMM